MSLGFLIPLFFLLAGILIGVWVPATRRSSLRLLRGGLFAALCGAALYILARLLLGHRPGSVPVDAVLTAATVGLNVYVVAFISLRLLRPDRGSV